MVRRQCGIVGMFFLATACGSTDRSIEKGKQVAQINQNQDAISQPSNHASDQGSGSSDANASGSDLDTEAPTCEIRAENSVIIVGEDLVLNLKSTGTVRKLEVNETSVDPELTQLKINAAEPGVQWVSVKFSNSLGFEVCEKAFFVSSRL